MPCSEISSLQNRETINFCCLSHPQFVVLYYGSRRELTVPDLIKLLSQRGLFGFPIHRVQFWLGGRMHGYRHFRYTVEEGHKKQFLVTTQVVISLSHTTPYIMGTHKDTKAKLQNTPNCINCKLIVSTNKHIILFQENLLPNLKSNN